MFYKILLFFLVVTLTSYAQKIDQNNFNLAVDILNCKANELSLKESGKDSVYNDFIKKCPCIKSNKIFTNLKNIIDSFKNEKKFENNVALFNEIENLKKSRLPDDINKLIKFLTQDIFDKPAYKELSNFKQNRINKNSFDGFIKNLKDAILSNVKEKTITDKEILKIYSAKIDSLFNKIDSLRMSISKLDTNLNSRVNDLESKNCELKKNNNVLLIIFLILGLAIVFFIIFYKLFESFKKWLKTDVENEIKSIRKQCIQLSSFLSSATSSKNNIKESSNEQNEKSKQEKKEDTPKETSNKEDKKKPQDDMINPKVFYAEAPNEQDGSFNIHFTTNVLIPNKSVFIFSLQNESEATFTIIDDPDIMKRAINLFYSILNPVCKNLGAYRENATKVIIKKGNEGIVMKEGDKWILIDKAIIELK